MKYQVHIPQIHYAVTEIVAETAEDALAKAKRGEGEQIADYCALKNKGCIVEDENGTETFLGQAAK